MKRSFTLFLSLLCVVAMLLPIAVTALPASDYAGTAETPRVEAFADYLPTSTNNVFNGYPGPYTVDSFKTNDPAKLTTLYQLDTVYNILCSTQWGNGGGDQWTYGGMYLDSSDRYRGRLILPAEEYGASITYHATRNGTVNISIDQLATSHDGRVEGPVIPGAKLAIFKNGVKIWPTTGNAEDGSGFFVYRASAASDGWAKIHFLNEAKAYQSFPTGVSVQEGDVISFAMVNAGGHMGFVFPRITYTSYCGESYTQSESFCGLQGSGSFYAGYSPKGSTSVYAMPAYDSSTKTFGGKSGAGSIGSGTLTVESGSDTVLLFRSPLIATYTLSSPVFSTTGNTTFTATVYRAAGSVTRVAE